MKRTTAALATAILVLAACASEGTTTTPDVAEPSTAADDHSEEHAVAGDGDPKDGDEAKKGSDRRDKSRKKSGSLKASGGAANDGTEDRDEGVSTGGGSGTGRKPAPYPAAGTYTFTQSGYEEFCDSAGNCDREDLPGRQPVAISYARRADSSAVVVSEQKASRSRVARTWTEFTPSGARVTKLYVRFEYSGFGFERTYAPEPPVHALRFPFRSGASWAGRWKASTSGSYRVAVGDRTPVQVGSRTLEAYRVETTTEFRGDLEGKSRITTYVDPATKAIVAANGVLNVTSQFGRYSTVFDTRLLEGPGY